MQITRKSPISDKIRTREINVTNEHIKRWKSGVLIQHAMPHLSADDREFIKTGITTDEWPKENYIPRPFTRDISKLDSVAKTVYDMTVKTGQIDEKPIEEGKLSDQALKDKEELSDKEFEKKWKSKKDKVEPKPVKEELFGEEGLHDDDFNHIVWFQKGHVVGARSHRGVYVKANDETHAEKIATSRWPTHKKEGYHVDHVKVMKEEKLDEISLNTLSSYVRKAYDKGRINTPNTAKAVKRLTDDTPRNPVVSVRSHKNELLGYMNLHTAAKIHGFEHEGALGSLHQGNGKAIVQGRSNKIHLAKEEEQIDEVSASKLVNYTMAARADQKKTIKSIKLDDRKGKNLDNDKVRRKENRDKGLELASNKLTAPKVAASEETVKELTAVDYYSQFISKQVKEKLRDIPAPVAEAKDNAKAKPRFVTQAEKEEYERENPGKKAIGPKD
jgi:hypothetical protein